jgi:asparagine synthase (glutamine-hydrolysing)
MCGILGIITLRGNGCPPDRFAYALRQIRHRGPDDQGTFETVTAAGAHVMLGHTRLSILDLSPAGHQPMFSPRTGTAAVYNGEVYNFRETRAELEKKGYTFTSQSDTEVILANYDERGEDYVDDLRGIFAIALWDAKRQRLVLTRDRLGVKPLYYYWDGNRLAFASEVTALAALPGLDLQVSQEAIRNYLLRGFIAHPLSIFEKVQKLPAGCQLVLDVGTGCIDIRRYWDSLDYYTDPLTFKSVDEVVEAVHAELREAVRLELVSDVPLGAFLSGGIDSSTIVALMRQVHTGTVRTFSIGFTEPEWNEAPAARLVAQHLGTQHEEFYLSEQNILEAARTAGDHYDEPFADSSNIPTLALSRMTRQHVTVALSGDGGDELFWGYDSYTSRSVANFNKFNAIPRPVRKLLATSLRTLRGTRFERLGHVIGFDDFPSFYMCSSHWHPWAYPRLHRHSAIGNRFVNVGREVMERINKWDQTLLMGAMDLRCYMVDDILTKVDRASMAYALEARVPVIDHKLVELACRIPSEFKMHGGVKKYLLKAVLNKYVPRKLWDRPKMGFGVPLGTWLRSSLKDWAYDELTGDNPSLHQWLDKSRLRQMLDDHISGKHEVSDLIWACIQLAGWERRVRAICGRSESASLICSRH